MLLPPRPPRRDQEVEAERGPQIHERADWPLPQLAAVQCLLLAATGIFLLQLLRASLYCLVAARLAQEAEGRGLHHL